MCRTLHLDPDWQAVCVDGRRWYTPSAPRYWQVRRWAASHCTFACRVNENSTGRPLLEFHYATPKEAVLPYPPRSPYEVFRGGAEIGAYDVAKAWRSVTADRLRLTLDRQGIEYLYDRHLRHHDDGERTLVPPWERVNITKARVQEDMARETGEQEIDLSIPLLFVTLPGETPRFLIDGWHRLYKAYHSGVLALSCYVFSRAESDALRLPSRPAESDTLRP